MKRLNILIAIFCLGIFMTSCNKDEDPKVTITSPSASASFSVTDVLELRANITDDNSLETILITSTLGLNQTITTFDSETSHNVAFDITFDPTTPVGVYNVTILATDDEGNTGSDEVEITVQ